MSRARRDGEQRTYGDYVGWPEYVRYEIVDDVAYLMARASWLTHQAIAGSLEASRG